MSNGGETISWLCLYPATGSLSDHSGWGTVSAWSGGVWLPAGNLQESGTASVISVEVRDSVPVPAAPSRFLLLKVNH